MASLLHPKSQSLVRAIVEDISLTEAVASLDVDSLAALVRSVGLEDSGSLLTLATTQQLRALADEELWYSRPGQPESFDSDRFGVWLEVLLDEGGAFAADTLLELDEDLLALALSQHALVLDLDTLAPGFSSGAFDDARLAEKILESSLSHELDEFLLLAQNHSGWDALVAVLHDLDVRDHSLVRRLLERTCAATMHRVEHDGLVEVLTSAATLMEDARSAREERRERRGFVSNLDAVAFLRLADEAGAEIGQDPMTKSYFRNFEPTPAVSSEVLVRLRAAIRSVDRRDVAALPEVAEGSSPTRAFIRGLRERAPETHSRLITELTYLANVLRAGVSLDGEPLRRAAALQAVLTICDASGCRDTRMPSLIRRFGAGWKSAATDQPDDPLRHAAHCLRCRMR